MTIKEFAKNKGISTQAVYQRIKGAKIELSSLKSGDQLSPDGLARLEQLFTAQDRPSIDKLTALEADKAALQATVDRLEALLKEARQQRDQWQQQAMQSAQALEAAQKIADQAQQLNAAAMQRIALPAPKGFLSRLFHRDEKKENKA